MLYIQSNALQVAGAALGKIKQVSRPVAKFVLHIVELWLSMNCRYVFTSMQRWGTRTEKSYRRMFSKFFDWFGFNYELVRQHCGGDVICVFDPCFIKKSGKKTYGLGKFWSGTLVRALKGLEVGCLCFVDATAGTALHGVAEQSPSPQALKGKGRTLLEHYRGVVKKHIKDILALTRYLVVDGYFMKREFMEPLLKEGLEVITKMRQDANLKYLYQGPLKKGKGRARSFDGKVVTSAVDKRRVRCCYRQGEVSIYSAVLWAVRLKRRVRACFVYHKGKDHPEIIISTDTQLDAGTICRYYGLRFQTEFLIRDAKQYTGLEDCQARSKEKLHTHFNVALTAVSLAKVAYWLPLPQQQRGGFSMMDIKMLHMNRLITKRIFDNLDLDLSCRKIKQLYLQCLNFGRLRA